MKKQGFTLVELLGVLLILSLLLVIVVPVVSSIMKNSKAKANEDQKNLIVESAKLWVADNSSSLSDVTGDTYEISLEALKSGGYLKAEEIKDLESKVSLSKACVIVTTNENSYGYEFNDECYSYTNGMAIYYNARTNKTCTSDKLNSTDTGTGELGCYRWFVIGYDSQAKTVNLLLDHNTTSDISYNSDNVNTVAKQAAEALTSDVSSWYSTVRSTARLITAEEIAKITGNTTFATNPTAYYFQTNSSTEPNPYTDLYGWLNSNINGCAKCLYYDMDISYTYGYWTSTAVKGSTTDLWTVSADNSLVSYSANSGYKTGIRPVITVPMSIIGS